MSIEVIKECLRIQIDDEFFLIKKDCVLGYGEKQDGLIWQLTIYTNIAKKKFIMNFKVGTLDIDILYPHTKTIICDETVKEEYRKCINLLDSILLAEVPELIQPSVNILRN
jgi:hypothetical protein